MNYRHEFHAGNFADVLKHVFLVRILLYLARKEKPFRFIDSHAGAGLYDLQGPEAARSGEAREGILRLLEAEKALGAAAELLSPYLDAVRAAGGPNFYPGSPVIAQNFLRAQDRALFCETLPQAGASLRRALGRDERAKILCIDGFLGLRAFTPPPERRGLILIDPPFERRDDYERVFDALAAVRKKWPGGIVLVWQPIKASETAESFGRAVAALAPEKILFVELQVETPAPGRPLARTGLIVVNPPHVLEAEAQKILPQLTRLFRRGAGAGYSLRRCERPAPPPS